MLAKPARLCHLYPREKKEESTSEQDRRRYARRDFTRPVATAFRGAIFRNLLFNPHTEAAKGIHGARCPNLTPPGPLH